MLGVFVEAGGEGMRERVPVRVCVGACVRGLVVNGFVRHMLP
jgi:hypothetical protein